MKNWRLDRNADSVEGREFEHLRRHICYGKDSPAPPPAPDYKGAAVATAEGNQQAAQTATKANRVNQYSPYGSSTYTQADPNDPNSQWSQNISLSDTGQKLLDSLNQSQIGTAGLEKTATDRVANTMSQPFDLGGANDATNKAYANITSRLDPQWQANSSANDAKLANQGITQGSEAYNNAMRTFNQAKNDAYTQANTSAMNFAPQTYQMDLAARNQPLNELNAIRTGSQVTNPAFGAVPQQGQVGGPNYAGATASQGTYDQNIYNQQVGQNNANTSGMYGLGSAAIAAMAMY